MKKVLTSICLFICASSVRAAEITVRSSLNETLEAHSNYQLQPVSPGPTYISNSNLNLYALARTPTMRFEGSVDLSYRTYFGPGAELLVPAFNRGFWGSIEKNEKLTTYQADASHRVRDASQVQLEETGFITIGGEVITDSVGGRIRHQLNSRDSIAWSARATSTKFTSPTGTDSLNVSTAAMWTHRVSELTSVMPMFDLETIDYANATNTEVMISRWTLGWNSQLTKRLSVRGAAGIVHLTSSQNNGMVVPETTLPETTLPEPTVPETSAPQPTLPVTTLPGTFGSASGSAIDWIGNLSLTYRLNNTNSLSFAAAQTVGPDTLGTIRKVQTAGVVLSHRINNASGLTFSANYSHQESSAAASDMYTLAAVYDHRFSREWRGTASYGYRRRVDEQNDADSHSVVFSLTWDRTLLAGAE